MIFVVFVKIFFFSIPGFPWVFMGFSRVFHGFSIPGFALWVIFWGSFFQSLCDFATPGDLEQWGEQCYFCLPKLLRGRLLGMVSFSRVLVKVGRLEGWVGIAII